MSATVRGIQQAAITSGGPTQDFAVSGAFGGANPKGLVTFMSGGITDETNEDHARFSIGLSDGTRHRCIGVRAQDGVLTSANFRQGRSNRIAYVYSGSANSSQGDASLSSFGPDKATYNWNTIPASAFLTNAVLFGGSNMSCYVSDFAGSTTQDAELTFSTTQDPELDPGFQPDGLIIISRGNQSFDDTGTTQYVLMIGLVVFTGSTIDQGCLAVLFENGVASSMRVGSYLSNNRCLQQLLVANPATAGTSVECTGRTSTGFKMTTRGGTTALRGGYLAFSHGGALQGLSLHSRDSRTSNGSDDFDTPGFPLQAFLGAYSHCASANSIETDADGGTFGMGFASASEQFSSSNTYQQGVSTSNTKSMSADVQRVNDHVGNAGIRFGLTDFDVLGANLDYMNAISPARKQLFLAIGRNSTYGKAMCVSAGAPKAQVAATHAGRSRVASEAVGLAVGSVSASGTTHLGRGAGAGSSVARATGAVSHAGKSRGAADATSKALGASTHGARARASTSLTSVAKASVAHGGRARASSSSTVKARAMSAHAGRAKSSSAGAGIARGTVTATGTTHLGRGAGVGGSSGRARAAVAHAGRAKAASGAVARGLAKKAAAGKSRASSAGGLRASAKKAAAGKARAGSAGAAKGAARSTRAGRSRATSEAAGRASAKHSASGRARASSGIVGKAVSSTELLGFYERTSKKVRVALRLAAGALPIQYSNLPFAEPQGVAWARAWVDFDEVQEVQYGSGRATYRAPGILRVELRTPIQEGAKASADLADALAAALELRQTDGVIYSAADVRAGRFAGDDEDVRTLRIPFRAEDSSFSRAAPGVVADDDFNGAEAQVRARFRSLLPTVAVTYDNLPSATGATWVRLELNETEAFLVDTVRRTVGVMLAEIHTPLQEGERDSLQLADKIVEAFRLVDAGGVKFSVPYLQGARQVLEDWVLPVYCPWSCDHA